MSEDAQQAEGRRSAAKRALVGAAGPLVGYFDRRFQDLHDHIDNQADFDRLAHDIRHELDRTRTDVAADTDTIAELAFTLERFADQFTARMEELADHFAAVGTRDADVGSSIVEHPFAFAAAAALERGANVATVHDDGRLSVGLVALGLRVSALDPTATIVHPDVAMVDEPIDQWGGPYEPFDAIFELAAAVRGHAHDGTSPAHLERLGKWLRPTGFLVVTVRLDPDTGESTEMLDQLRSGWDVERSAYFDLDSGGAWRERTDVPTRGVALIRAAVRA